jgi:hypothetical protein
VALSLFRHGGGGLGRWCRTVARGSRWSRTVWAGRAAAYDANTMEDVVSVRLHGGAADGGSMMIP